MRHHFPKIKAIQSLISNKKIYFLNSKEKHRHFQMSGARKNLP